MNNKEETENGSERKFDAKSGCLIGCGRCSICLADIQSNKIGGEAESWLERLKYLCFYSDGEDGLNLTGIQLKAVINFISQEIKQAEERGRNYLATHPEYHDELKLARQEGKKEAVEELISHFESLKYPLRAKEDHLPNVYMFLKGKNEAYDIVIRDLRELTNYKKEKDL